MLKILLIIGAFYVGLVFLLFIFQRNILFVPDRSKPNLTDSNVTEMSEVNIETKDGLTLLSWFYRGQAEKPVIIYFQGNAGNISDRDYKARFLIDNGFSVLLMGYRGYGGNQGQPSEEGLRKDGEAALAFAAKEGFKKTDIILYGESLGTGVVVNLGIGSEFKGLILEAPFTSAADVGQRAFPIPPVKFLILDRFDSLMITAPATYLVLTF